MSDEMRAFLEYVRSGKATGDDRNLAHRIENDLTMAREYKRWEAEFMTLEEKLKDEREEGRREGQQLIIEKMLLKLPPEEVANVLGMDEAELKKFFH